MKDQRASPRPIRTNKQRAALTPSPALAYLAPWLSIIVASMLPGWVIISAGPLIPPLGYLMLVAWRQLRPDLLPVWAGLPLGLIDDLFSGQPFGSAILLWSVTMLALDVLEHRFPWRNFVTEWLVAAAMIIAYLMMSLEIANAGGGATSLLVLAPQMLLGVLAYPVMGRVVARIDQARLTRFRVFG